MEVFISWSGEKSRRLGEILSRWLPRVIQSVEPFFSPDDTQKGSNWHGEISRRLDRIKVGILVITPENLRVPWLLYEAGALAKSVGKSHVCPILFGMKPTDVTGPLAHLQMTEFNEEDMCKLLSTVNSVQEKPLKAEILQDACRQNWPDLKTDAAGVLDEDLLDELFPEDSAETRNDREIMEEILENVRWLKSNTATALQITDGQGNVAPRGTQMELQSPEGYECPDEPLGSDPDDLPF